LVSLQETANLLASDCRACKDAGNFEDAVKLARLYAKLAPAGQAQLLMAQTLEAWAGAQHARAPQLKGGAQAQEEAAARLHYAEAASAYEAAAAALAGQPEEGEWLWRAGTCALEGQALGRALAAYQRVVNLRPPLARLSE